ncbi:MAG TPA: chromate efflux transporter [Methylomirabilota bacterium]|jgi:chromate transporter
MTVAISAATDFAYHRRVPAAGQIPPGSLREVAALFLKLGFVAFGGPAAHIALMRDEVVRRRRWMTEQQFLDLLGASNLIPGPTSTELAIYLGYARGGWRGLVLAGALFILPAALISLALAWLYVRYGSSPQAAWLLYGIKPVIIAVVVQAIWALARTAVKGWLLAATGALVLALYAAGFNEIVLLLGAGVLVAAARSWGRRRRSARMLALAPLPMLAAPALPAAVAASAVDPVSLFLVFLKIGAVLYGSGYVLLAFLRNDFVVRLGWLTDQQLIDAVAVGQLTPGPVFTTATFIGYVVAGASGAALSTLAIFLPSFVFVALVYPFVPRLRASAPMSAFLDGVNVAAIGLMLAVTWQLARSAVVDWPSAGVAVVATVLLLRWRINSVWLIAGGATFGAIARGLGR